MKNTILNLICVAYWVAVMLIMVFMITLYPFIAIGQIGTVRTSGFAGPDNMFMISVMGLFIGLSLLIPVFRRMYHWFPWLYAFIKIFFLNTTIMIIATTILNFGYRVQDSTRHTIFFVLMLCFIVAARALMCLYFHRKKVEYVGRN